MSRSSQQSGATGVTTRPQHSGTGGSGMSMGERSSLLGKGSRHEHECYLTNMLGTQSLLLATTVVMFIWLLSENHLGGLGTKGNQWFNWHPFLNFIAFLCFSEGMVLYGAAANGNMDMRKVHRYHAILSTIGLAAMITAIVVVHGWKENMDVPHYYSVHSWLGMLTLTLAVTQWLVGTIVWCAPNAVEWCSGKFMHSHHWLGKTGYLCLWATVLLGLHNEQSILPGHDAFTTDKVFSNWLAVLIALTGSFVVYWIMIATNAAQDQWYHGNSYYHKTAGDEEATD